jgi:hypothetical protein
MRITNLLFVVLFLMLSSCGGMIKSYIRKDTENVPQDFGKQKTILLVLEQKQGYNKDVEEILNKYYSGEYAFVSKEDLNIKPYQDTIKYRYLLNDNLSMNQTLTGSSPSVGARAGQQSNQMVSTASRSFRIIDRQTQKVYDTGVSSGASWKTVLKAYLIKLDDERKKNGGN